MTAARLRISLGPASLARGVAGDERRSGTRLVDVDDCPDGADESAVAVLVEAPGARALGSSPTARPLDPGRVSVEERVHSASRVHAIVQAMIGHQRRGQAISNQARAALVPVECVGVDSVLWRVEGALPEVPFEVSLPGYNSVFRLRVDSARPVGALIETPLPDEIVRERQRWRRRVAAPASSRVAFEHPVTGLRVEAPLHDLSAAGFSFASDGSLGRLHIGLPLRAVELVLPEGDGAAPEARLPVDGAYIRFADADVVGVALDQGPEGEAALRERVDLIAHPRTRAGADAGATWRLYDRAGYFSLSNKSARDFDALRAAFVDVSQKFIDAPAVAVQVAWPAEGEPLGTLSMFRLYSTAWYGYQMAKVRGDAPDGTPGGVVLRDLHVRAYEHVQRDPHARWLLGLVQVKRVWSRLAHHDIVRRYAQTGLAAVVRCHPLEIDARASTAPDAQFEVVEATGDVREAFFRHVATVRPRAYVEALDLSEQTFDDARHGSELRAAGIGRSREILVALDAHGRARAAALLEVVDEGVHVFRLFDLARLYALAPGGDLAFPSLIVAARAYYRRHGKPTFVCVLEDDGAPLSEAIARETLTDMGLADLTILSTDLLPELLEHVTEITAPKARPR